jgi:hypothetical protein
MGTLFKRKELLAMFDVFCAGGLSFLFRCEAISVPLYIVPPTEPHYWKYQLWEMKCVCCILKNLQPLLD